MSKTSRTPLLIFFGFIAFLIAISLLIVLVVKMRTAEVTTTPISDTSYQTFQNCSQLANWLNSSKTISYPDKGIGRDNDGGESPAEPTTPGGQADYSKTNIQVAGVDEPDIIKTDGTYIYAVKDKTISIIKQINGAFALQSTISLSYAPNSLFIENGKLVAFVNNSRAYDLVYDVDVNYYPGYGDQSAVSVYVYDVTNITTPKFLRKISVEGYYQDARLSGGVVYMVSNFNSRVYEGEITASSVAKFMPQISDTESDTSDFMAITDCSKVAYAGNPSANFTVVSTLDLKSMDSGAKVVATNTEAMYADADNLYLVNALYKEAQVAPCDTWDGILLPERCIVPQTNSAIQTGIYKYKLAGTQVEFLKEQRIDGHILNQFSLDEFGDNLRIAVTTGADWINRSASASSIHVLDKDLNEIGVVKGLGEGENLYSVRFMGNRAYVVTFRQVDPFYVIDLKDPKNPKLMGELKIPGFSNYLQLYDENHVVGFGKEATSTDAPWFQGLKFAMFDVTDPTDPKEKYRVNVGDGGSDSEVLYNHKALLMDKSRSLLVVPVAIMEKSDEIFQDYYEYSFTGFIVYKIDTNKGFVEVGRIKSSTDTAYWYNTQGSRSFYIGNNLFTYAKGVLKSHTIADVKAIDEYTMK